MFRLCKKAVESRAAAGRVTYRNVQPSPKRGHNSLSFAARRGADIAAVLRHTAVADPLMRGAKASQAIDLQP